jgi:hypothetical protein
VIRLACLLALIALAILPVLVADLSGATATLFVFVGMPALGLALLIYFLARWRAGAFDFNDAGRPAANREVIR